MVSFGCGFAALWKVGLIALDSKDILGVKDTLKKSSIPIQYMESISKLFPMAGKQRINSRTQNLDFS